MKQLISHEELLRVLDYNPETGIFTRKVGGSGSKNKVGGIAGCLHSSGYTILRVQQTNYYAHRLAWFYVYGVWPKMLDHKDTIKSHNWVDNLRETTNEKNQFNTNAKNNNKSGYKGVHFSKDKGLWRARCVVGGKEHHLGYFPIPELASEAYKTFAKKHHGDFYRE